MASYKLSLRARSDIAGIGRFTKRTWGNSQADMGNSAALQDDMELIGVNPLLGRPAEGFGKGLRRLESGSHVIFYENRTNEVTIARILHKGMLPGRHRSS